MAQNNAELDWVKQIPELDALQAGALKRMFDLSSQLPDDWSGMMGQTTLQEDFGSLRFQLAYMAYALALTHVHRMPAAPAVFRQPFDNLIQKILSPDCWLYWHYVSTGNGPFNSRQGELPAEWDPVARDNIMYSAYVQSMVLLYHYLFRDAKYADEGSLKFSINPLFWGAGGKHFTYDEHSLNDHLYWGMVERGFLGIACEPNCVFQICNQPPILGFRLHDLIYGGNTAEEVSQGYLRAWADFGVTTPDGHFNMMIQEHERVVITPPDAPWVDFWLGALMHAWNPEFVEQYYPGQLTRWSVEGPDGTLVIPPEGPMAPDEPRVASARDFGWAAVCASEVGDSEGLERMLAYADRFLNPVWQDGAYFYPRNDELQDAEGRFTAMDPHTGNVLLGYARLNVPHGLRKLYDGPWDDRHFAEPAVVAISGRPDLRRAWFDSERNALALTIGDGCGATPVKLEIGNVEGRDLPRLIRDNEDAPISMHREGDRLVIQLDRPVAQTMVLAW
ncbi:linalool dehydratase/isomerase domain-containing protein [Novosphingobium sp.]|uniref:linalool dehydratase/isomerase domain-containing protein n=1 Tax=Novosphingobium sp. TaxID=1874826 RepID=UPI002FD979F3